MGLKMGHHFTAPLMSGPHQFLVYTFNISVEKTPLIHMVYCIHTLQVYLYVLSLYADTMKVHLHNTAYLVQLHSFNYFMQFTITLCLFFTWADYTFFIYWIKLAGFCAL